MSENIRYILTLTIICFTAASLVTGIYLLTQPKILEQKAKQEQEALEEVMPEAGYFEPVTQEGELLYYRAYLSADKKRILGCAFRAQGQGYAGVIESMAGIDRDGRISGIRILEHNETPGLGARINEVLAQKTLGQAIEELLSGWKNRPSLSDQRSEPWFCAQFKGKRIKELNNVQAITGATISSQALIDSVQEKGREVLEYESR